MGIRPVWRAAAVVYFAINVGGAAWAASYREGMHAALHVVLLLVGVAGVMWWRSRPDRAADEPDLLPEAQRLEHLQQSVDAIALEVERIGEAQRFTAKLQAERTKSPL